MNVRHGEQVQQVQTVPSTSNSMEKVGIMLVY